MSAAPGPPAPNRAQAMHQDRETGATVLDPAPPSSSDPLLRACQLVGAALGISIQAPPHDISALAVPDALQAIARAAPTRIRQVALKGSWWRNDHGPLLGFIDESKQPVALLPGAAKRYELHNPGAGTRCLVTRDVAWSLAPFAHTFVRPLPMTARTASALLRFGLRECQPDLWMVLGTGVAAGLLGLVPVLATRWIIDRVIPTAERDQALWLLIALLAVALGNAALYLLRNLAVLRIETRLSTALQSAVWDRLLSLPVTFFRQYSAGDLAFRALGIERMRQLLSGATVSALLAGIFSLFNLLLLFVYDVQMAWIALLLIGLAVAAMMVASLLSLSHERASLAVQARLAGLGLQLINGIPRLRMAGAESRAFNAWAQVFASQRSLIRASRTIGVRLAVFNAIFPLGALLVFFALVAARPGQSTGTFLAFLAAFGNVLSAALLLSAGFLALLRVVPLFEQVQPILEALPEQRQQHLPPGKLSGRIDLAHVAFRYQRDGPFVLNDLSLSIQPGEFVALVGPSGSGKSTLVRLLLGFEQPEHGAIKFDGQPLAQLDGSAVRRQIGVVLQHGRLLPGDVLTNISGAAAHSVEDAWAAAAQVGLDADIRRFPMGMYTVVSEATSTFSSGQVQRLMLARALVGRPRLLILDEATSALDNRTQALVSQSLEKLNVTRLVIAQRLSTIRHADRIYVLDGGNIVQHGTFAELAEQDGVFRELMRRQML